MNGLIPSKSLELVAEIRRETRLAREGSLDWLMVFQASTSRCAKWTLTIKLRWAREKTWPRWSRTASLPRSVEYARIQIITCPSQEEELTHKVPIWKGEKPRAIISSTSCTSIRPRKRKEDLSGPLLPMADPTTTFTVSSSSRAAAINTRLINNSIFNTRMEPSTKSLTTYLRKTRSSQTLWSTAAKEATPSRMANNSWASKLLLTTKTKSLEKCNNATLRCTRRKILPTRLTLR